MKFKGVIKTKQLEKAFRQLAKNASPQGRQNLFRDLAGDMMDISEEAFKTEGRSLGKPWERLAPLTVRMRESVDRGSRPILQVTGQLATSVNVRSTSEYAAIGTNKKYAATHQYGDTRYLPKGNFYSYVKKPKFFVPNKGGIRTIPARPFIGLSAKDIDMFEKKVLRAALKGVKK